MLKSILKTLNGHGSEAASLEAALLQLGRDRDETRVKIVELKKQRHTALLDDLEDAAIGKIDLAIDRAEVRLEKLNAAEPPLLEKLTGARSAARQKRWLALHEAYLGVAGKFLALARSAADLHSEMIAIVDRAQREGFAGEVAAKMAPTPNINGKAILESGLLDAFERAILPPTAPYRRTAARAPKPISPPRGTSSQHAVSTVPARPNSLGSMSAQRAADDLAPLAPGEVRVRVLRAGYSASDDTPQCHHGQLIRMSLDVAERAAGTGAVEILDLAPVVPPATAAAVPSAEAHPQGAK